MQTFSEICIELGYNGPNVPRRKLQKAGVSLSSLPRFLGDDHKTLFYDDETKKYLASVLGECNQTHKAAAMKHVEPRKVLVRKRNAKPTDTKVIGSRSVAKAENTVQAGKTEVESAVAKAAEVSIPNLIQKKGKKKVTPVPAKPKVAASPDYESRLQQVKVLGDLLIQQIEMLSHDMTAKSAAAAS